MPTVPMVVKQTSTLAVLKTKLKEMRIRRWHSQVDALTRFEDLFNAPLFLNESHVI